MQTWQTGSLRVLGLLWAQVSGSVENFPEEDVASLSFWSADAITLLASNFRKCLAGLWLER